MPRKNRGIFIISCDPFVLVVSYTMSLSTENILLIGSVLLFISIVVSKTSFRFGIPSLVLFLAVGMLAGSDGPGGIYFNDPKATQFLGAVALAFILFSGGLETKMESIRPVLKTGLSLATLGVLITALIVGTFASYVLDISWTEGMLIGSIVSSTDAAAVFSILRTRSIGLKGNIRPLLEFESGSNDPMAYFLTIGFTYLVQEPEASALSLVPRFFYNMAIGGLCGYVFGRVMTWVVNKIKLDIEGLYPVLILALLLFTFSFTEQIHGNGYLALYISAVILGNSNFIHKKSLMKFYDGQSWLMQIVMFLTLGLLVFPSKIVPVLGPSIWISIVLIFLARPVAVFISLLFSQGFNFRKKLFLSWVGLRGAVPIVFATYPLLAGIEYASTIFHVVFFISATSILLQGTTIPLMARWLHVSVPENLKRKFPVDIELKESTNSELVELDILAGSPAAGKAIVQLGLPKNSHIAMIHRGNTYVTPSGDTQIAERDHLLVMADSKETIEKVKAIFHH